MLAPIIKASGNIAIVWGTPNALGNMTGIILETLTITPKNAMPIDIEDGPGFAAIQSFLEDGFDAKASWIFDSAKALPAAGSNIVLQGPNLGGTGLANYNCTFWSASLTQAKKKESLCELTFTRRPGING